MHSINVHIPTCNRASCKSSRDDTLLTVGFNLRGIGEYLRIPAKLRRGDTSSMHGALPHAIAVRPVGACPARRGSHCKSRRDGTLLTVCFSIRPGAHSTIHGDESRRDDTLLTVCFSIRQEGTPTPTKSRRDDTLLTVCFSIRQEGAPTPTKSRRDDTLLTVCFSIRQESTPTPTKSRRD
jgi:hypothetical protein